MFIRNLMSRTTKILVKILQAIKNGIVAVTVYLKRRPTHVKVALVYLLGVCLMVAFFIWNASRFATPRYSTKTVENGIEKEEEFEYSFPGKVEPGDGIDAGAGKEDEPTPAWSNFNDNGIASGHEEERMAGETEDDADSQAEGEETESNREEEKVILPEALWPVKNGTVLVEFGEPLTRSGSSGAGEVIEFHRGVKIAAAPGAQVKAVWEGQVKTVKTNDLRYGKSVLLEHPKEKTTFYGSLGEIKVEEGEQVESGATLGSIEDGSAADSGLKEPHLYLKIHLDQKPRDPLEYLP